MTFWQREPFDSLISEGHFNVVDAGPLHSPIRSFTLRRNDKLQLVLTTVGDGDAIANELLRQTGLHNNASTVQLQSIFGTSVTLVGVQPLSVHTFTNRETRREELREEASVHRLSSILDPATNADYTIDWLENVFNDYYLWPDLIVDNEETIKTRTFGRGEGALVITNTSTTGSHGRRGIDLSIGGINIKLCSSKYAKQDGQLKPGFILYSGRPDEDTRRKIRTVLSFSLGQYFVHLGHSTYSSNWRLLSFEAISAYSIDKKAFDLITMPPTLLGERAHNELSHAPVSRLSNALYSHYDELNFGGLSWAYWHAICAPLHIAAVHFGAAIEALERKYVEAHSQDFSTTILTRPAWQNFAGQVDNLIGNTDIADEAKSALRANLGLINQVTRRAITEDVLCRTGVVLGDDERRAWPNALSKIIYSDFAAPEILLEMKNWGQRRFIPSASP